MCPSLGCSADQSKINVRSIKMHHNVFLGVTFYTCSQNRQSTKFQNHENINFVEKLYFFILYNKVYIAKHDVKPLHSGFIFRENTSHYKVGG